jgi:hypothetical protein
MFREVSEDYSQIYTSWLSGTVQEHKQLSEDNLMAWKELYSNRWNLTQPFQYKQDKKGRAYVSWLFP